MKILKCRTFYKVESELARPVLCSTDINGWVLEYENRKIVYKNWPPKATSARRVVKIEGKSFQLFGNGLLSLRAFIDGSYYLKDKNGNLPNISVELAYAYAVKHYFMFKNSRFAIFEMDYPKDGLNSVVSFDLLSKIFCFKECNIVSPAMLGDDIYGWDIVTGCLSKLDDELNELWISPRVYDGHFNQSGSLRSITPDIISEGVLLYLGHAKNEYATYNDKKICLYKSGLLYCFCQKNGQVKWSREFEWSVEDSLVDDGRLFVTTSTKLLELDPDSGKTIREIETGLESPEGFDRQSMGCLAELHASGSRLFYFNWISGTILVYDLATLELSHQLALPGGWRPRGVQFEDEDTGNLYIDVALGAGGPPEYHRSAMLELKPDQLDEPIEIEQGPPASIYMACSETNPEKEELWIEITTSSLDDALRFGTLHTQNHAYIQGRTLVSQHCDPNPKFNGRVHFRYFGSAESEERIDEMLRLLEDGFKTWVKRVGVYAGDGSNDLCQIDGQFIPNR